MSTPPASPDASSEHKLDAAAARRPDICVEMVSDPVYLSGARELVSAVAKRLGFADEASGQIALALDEALCNIMRHGYERRRDGPIWVSLWPLAEENGMGAGLRIVLEDEARQVDPTEIRSRDLDEVRPGGLGVHIIQEVMDEVRYEKRQTRGMRLTLVKWQKGKTASVDGGGESQRGDRGCRGT